RIAVNARKPAVVVIGPRGIVCVLDRRTRPKVRTVVHIRRTGGARHAVRSRAAVVPCHGRARRDRERRRAERQTHHTHLRGGRRAPPAPAPAPTTPRTCPRTAARCQHPPTRDPTARGQDNS